MGKRARLGGRAQRAERPGPAEAATVRCPNPRHPYSLPASALGGIWLPRPGPEIRSGARGAGRRLQGHFIGKGLPSKWIIPTAPGAGSGEPPPAANPQRPPTTKMKTTWSRGPRSPPPTASASSPTPRTPERNRESRLRPWPTSPRIPLRPDAIPNGP